MYRSSCSSLFLWCQGQLGGVAWKRMDWHQHTTLRAARLLKTSLCSRMGRLGGGQAGGMGRRSCLVSTNPDTSKGMILNYLAPFRSSKLIIHVSAKLECGFTYLKHMHIPISSVNWCLDLQWAKCNSVTCFQWQALDSKSERGRKSASNFVVSAVSLPINIHVLQLKLEARDYKDYTL